MGCAVSPLMNLSCRKLKICGAASGRGTCFPIRPAYGAIRTIVIVTSGVPVALWGNVAVPLLTRLRQLPAAAVTTVCPEKQAAAPVPLTPRSP